MEKIFGKMLAYVMMASLCIVACAGDGDDEGFNRKDLLGVWEVTEVEYPDGSKDTAEDLGNDLLRIGFEKDNVLVYYEKVGSNWVEESTGSYTISGSRLKFEEDGRSLMLNGDYIDEELTGNYSITVASLSESKLVLKEEGKYDGERFSVKVSFRSIE